MNNITVNEQKKQEKALQIEKTIINVKNMIIEVEKAIKGGTNLSEKYYYYLSLTPENLILKIYENDVDNITNLKEYLEYLEIGIEVLEEMKDDILNEDKSVNLLINNFFGLVDENNIEAVMFVEKVKSLISKGELIITTSLNGGSYYNLDFDYVAIEKEVIELGDYSVLIHELGHYFHKKIMDHKEPSNFEEIVCEARTLAIENGTLKKVLQVYKKIDDDIIEQAKKDITLKEIILEYSYLLKYYMKSVPFLNAIKISKEEVYAFLINSKVFKNREKIIPKLEEFSARFSDIIDAVYEGKRQDLGLNFFWVPSGHGPLYFSTKEKQFSEMIADFTALKVLGRQHDLELIKTMFGNDFYNMLDTTFSYFIQTSLEQEQIMDNQDDVQEFVETSQLQSLIQTQELFEQSVNEVEESNVYNRKARR